MPDLKSTLWIQRNLRGKKVYVRATPSGKPAAASDGRVEVRYSANPAAKIYRASLRNLEKTGEPEDDKLVKLSGPLADSSDDSTSDFKDGAQTPRSGTNARSRRAKRGKNGLKEAGTVIIPDDALVIYTDGACTGNPGPAGIGAVIIDGDQRRELSEYLGQGTNNIAELTAILRALEVLTEQRDRPVFLHSDSSYSLGLLTKNWKAKANVELVERLRQVVSRFSRLEFVKVKGHAGIPENERADELARAAVERRR